jgi:plasmid segregation protein ParM
VVAVVVAVDVGYGVTKVIRGGQQWAFPSLVGSCGPEKLGGLFGASGDGLDSLRVEVDGLGTFAVGELALHGAADATRAFEGQERWEHPGTRVLIDAALALALASGQPSGPLCLATGLPLAFWAGQRQAFAAWLRSLDDRVRLVGDGRRPGGWMRVAPSEVTVYPQAAGALYDALFDASGAVRDRELLNGGGLVGVVDVGYRTTDYLVLDLDRGLRVREDLCGMEDLGMVQLDQAVQRAFLAATGAVLPPEQVDRARRRGSVVYRGRPVDLSEDLRTAGESLARAIADRVKAAWGPQVDYLTRLHLAGGGSAALGDVLLQSFPGARIMPDAQFANARGFAAVAAVARLTAARTG